MSEHKRLRKGKGRPRKYLKKVKWCDCGLKFTPRIRTQVHCSAKCRNRAAQMSWRKRERKLRKAA